jgi:hypothetical protein
LHIRGNSKEQYIQMLTQHIHYHILKQSPYAIEDINKTNLCKMMVAPFFGCKVSIIQNHGYLWQQKKLSVSTKKDCVNIFSK